MDVHEALQALGQQWLACEQWHLLCCIDCQSASPVYKWVLKPNDSKPHQLFEVFPSKSELCAGGDTTIYDCNVLFDDQITYDAANDLADQRNALIDFYNSTGGPYWETALLSDTLRQQIAEFEAAIEALGEAAALSTFNLSSLSTEYQEVYEVVLSLSANCSLQRELQIIKLLLKNAWNTDGTSIYTLYLDHSTFKACVLKFCMLEL